MTALDDVRLGMQRGEFFVEYLPIATLSARKRSYAGGVAASSYQASSIEAAGVQMAQGYLFSAPLTARGLKEYHAFTTQPLSLLTSNDAPKADVARRRIHGRPRRAAGR